MVAATFVVLTSNKAMQINRNIAISESGFIFNPGTGDSFSTNSVGLEIIRLLQEAAGKEEILIAVQDKFAVDKDTAEKDLNDFIMVLHSYQLLNDHG